MRLSLFGGLAAIAVLLSTSVPAVADQNTIDQPVVFSVEGYEIHGDLVGPVRLKKTGSVQDAITIYLHGFGHGEWIWNLDVPGYNFAQEMAAAGHTSLIIDRLGYGASLNPTPLTSSIDLQARIAHDIVGQLRDGQYTTPGWTPWRFSHVALTGLSAGGLITEDEVETYQDVDAAGVFGWYDDISQGTPLVLNAFQQMGQLCASSTTGSEYFGQTIEEFTAINFYLRAANPIVVLIAAQDRNRDPCGDAFSVPSTAAASLGRLNLIRVPTVLIWGDHDATFQPTVPQQQALAYTAANVPFEQFTIPNSGHLLPLGDARRFRQTLGAWLATRGF